MGKGFKFIIINSNFDAEKDFDFSLKPLFENLKNWNNSNVKILFSFQQEKLSSLFSKIHLTVNWKNIIWEQGETVRKLLNNNQIQIPSLCNGHHTCKLCKVLVEYKPKLACST